MANEIKVLSCWLLLAATVVAGCTDDDLPMAGPTSGAARELTGIEAVISSGHGATRAGTVTTLADYVGRSDFKAGDRILFTDIHRTVTPLDNFTYPGKGYNKNNVLTEYDGIIFEAGEEGGWTRDESVEGPERVYWTDAINAHTFIAFSIPQDYGEYWKAYKFTQGTGDDAVKKTYYIGAIGNPTATTGADSIIDYYIDPYATKDVQVPNLDEEGNPVLDGEGNPTTKTVKEYLYRSLVNNDSVFTNPKLEDEDVVIAYDTEMKAQPGGSVALVQFYHALSSVRVVVNISGFAASSSAKDTETKVSNMRLLHQPTMYIWMQSGWGAQPLRATAQSGETLTDQQIVDAAWGGTGPAYDQRKDIRLWIPKPEGSGTAQSKTFTFYGITTPQPSDYVSTLTSDADLPYRTVELEFDVTYPNPMKPTTTVTKTYKATLPYGELYPDDNPNTSDYGVHFEAGHNTTINISLNHKNEEMTVGVEYENWQFVATPDQGELAKNSTFLQDTLRTSVTIVGDEKATMDDATWLYELNGTVYDIYGHTGTQSDPYQISTAYQLLSFAYEVKKGRDFEDQFIRLDADITLQSSSDKTIVEYVLTGDDDTPSGDDPIEWLGIGDATHAFNGTFLGGHRFIYRLYGKPFFANLGSKAKVKQLQVQALAVGNGDRTVVDGGGLFAQASAGRISGCRVVGDVVFNAATAGAFVGNNSGAVYASYHIGQTKGTATVGGLVGANTGIISSCYQSGVVSGGTVNRGISGSSTGEDAKIYNTYFNSSLFTYDGVSEGVSPRTSSQMTKQQFVDDLNNGITIWRTPTGETVTVGGEVFDGLGHDDYDPYTFVHQPANYPKLSDTVSE